MRVKLHAFEVEQAILDYIAKEFKTKFDREMYTEIHVKARSTKKDNKVTEVFFIPTQCRANDEIEVFIDTTDYSG